MPQDARYEDGDERPLALAAIGPDDLPVISALVQDAVLSGADIRWDRSARRLALLLGRFRWEDREAAERAGRPYERVRSLLVIGDVLRVSSQGIDKGDADLVLSLLSLDWQPGEDGTGRLVLWFAGDGALAADVECLDVSLRDVTRPYSAPSRRQPRHPD
ncbi:DUF2948 family protein [Frigidibacter oleivorans]|uniref:DUF2948 family protein n=1 Tax=Frigidibacter oleivorans TaxID=2487129 RepID=UPI000F8DB0DA|nr:DUF2948 family protein [Frigidibacter oleivorans]